MCVCFFNYLFVSERCIDYIIIIIIIIWTLLRIYQSLKIPKFMATNFFLYKNQTLSIYIFLLFSIFFFLFFYFFFSVQNLFNTFFFLFSRSKLRNFRFDKNVAKCVRFYLFVNFFFVYIYIFILLFYFLKRIL